MSLSFDFLMNNDFNQDNNHPGTSVIKQLKESQAVFRGHKKLSHRDIRKLLKKDRRKRKRREAAITKNNRQEEARSELSTRDDVIETTGDKDESCTSNEPIIKTVFESNLICEEVWIQREKEFQERKSRESKKNLAIQKAQEILHKKNIQTKQQS